MRFSDQLRMRRLNDEELVNKTYLEMADAVLGGRFAESYQSDRDRARTALSEVLCFYKIPLPQDMPETDDVYASIDAACRPSGIMYRRVSLESGWYRNSFGALLGMLESTGQIIALIPGILGGYSYFDAETGKRVRLNRRTEKAIVPEALFFYKPFPARALTVKDLAVYIKDIYRPQDIILPVLLAALVTILGLFLPALNEFLLDEVVREGRMTLLFSTIVFVTSLSVTRLLVNMIRSIYRSRIDTKIALRVEAATMMRLLDLPANFFRGYSSGEMAQRSGYVAELCSTIIDALLGTGLTSLFSIAYVASITQLTPALLPPSLVIILLTVVVSVANSLISAKIVRERMLVSGKESGVSYALINGIRKIRLGGAEKRALAHWGHLYAREAKLTYDPPAFLKLNAAITSAITFTGTFVLYLIASKSGITSSDYYAFNTAFGMVAGAFSGIADILLSIADIRPVYEMAEPILKTVPETGETKLRLADLTGRIEFAKVSFRYKENGPLILNDLSLDIAPGEFVAVVGRTGSGKSTLIRLLLGFETPQTGAIYYDDRDIRTLDLKSLRRRIGTVLQDGRLFSGDIFSNITISAPQLTLDDAWAAAETAGIADDIRRMPMGMSTLITEGGGGISGGQRQRLLIARAVASRPKILIFDEATSALDNITQKKVTDSLDTLHCTRIVIAHRLSTIRHADRILYLENGRIAESGTYEQLMEKSGRFAELIKRQQTEQDSE